MAEMRGGNNGQLNRATFAGGISPERWTGIVVLACLGLLILIRMGFRGVNLMGASARIG